MSDTSWGYPQLHFISNNAAIQHWMGAQALRKEGAIGADDQRKADGRNP